MRPYGVSLLVAGFDVNRGPTLYQVDPSGSFWAWKASAIGKNMTNAKTFLEKRCAIKALIFFFFFSYIDPHPSRFCLKVQRRYQFGGRDTYGATDVKGRVRGADDGEDYRNRSGYRPNYSRTGRGKGWWDNWASETNIPEAHGRGSA